MTALLNTNKRSSIGDDESDFGYDFSAEEEQLLIQLATQAPSSDQRESPLRPDDKSSVTIDSLPGRTESVISDAALHELENTYVPMLGTGVVSFPDTGAQAAAAEPRLRTTSPSDSAGKDIIYPDCMYSSHVGGGSGLTD